MEGKVIFSVLGLLVYHCLAKNIQVADDNDVYGDMLLTDEQKQMVKERGILNFNKWPKDGDGRVRIPYYIAEDSFDQAHLKVIRRNIKDAADAFRLRTCVSWYPVDESYAEHKVVIYNGNKCTSNVGMITDEDNKITIGGCFKKIGSIIHEMSHTVGVFHTQSRSDRDQYVQVWMNNVQEGMEKDFEILTESYGVPYDYKSVMHYSNMAFSNNGSFTITTLDPLAMFAIGYRLDSLRWSDALTINRIYDAEDLYNHSCRWQEKKCQNGGFFQSSCVCICPENTRGKFCETVSKPFFFDVPKCGGTITQPGEIKSPGYPHYSNLDKCIFKIVAPKCQLPSITITAAKFPEGFCRDSLLTVQVSKSYYGFQYCDSKQVPIGKPLVSESSTASVAYYTDVESAGVGFQAQVKFVADPAC